MTNLTHCDGPGCDVTKDDREPQRLCTEPWLQVEDGHRLHDFHSRACLLAYFEAADAI